MLQLDFTTQHSGAIAIPGPHNDVGYLGEGTYPICDNMEDWYQIFNPKDFPSFTEEDFRFLSNLDNFAAVDDSAELRQNGSGESTQELTEQVEGAEQEGVNGDGSSDSDNASENTDAVPQDDAVAAMSPPLDPCVDNSQDTQNETAGDDAGGHVMGVNSESDSERENRAGSQYSDASCASFGDRKRGRGNTGAAAASAITDRKRRRGKTRDKEAIIDGIGGDDDDDGGDDVVLHSRTHNERTGDRPKRRTCKRRKFSVKDALAMETEMDDEIQVVFSLILQANAAASSLSKNNSTLEDLIDTQGAELMRLHSLMCNRLKADTWLAGIWEPSK